MDTNEKETIISECTDLMSKAGYDGSKTDQFIHTVSDIIQEIIDHPDENREIRYRITKRIDRIEFRLDVSGDRIDPLTEGKGAEERSFRNAVNSVLFNPETSVSSFYTQGWNHLVVKSPSRIANSKLLNEPMVRAMLLGAAAGIIVRFLPEDISTVLLEGIAAPLMGAVLNLLMGIMGPVFFLFILTAVSSLGSAEELGRIGKVIIKRFLIITVWITILASAVALLFFPVFGKGDTMIDLPAIEGVLLGTLPKNFISPFAECNIPQVILLGLVFGTALLMMGESGRTLREAVIKIKEWIMGVMVLMMKILPLVPFISTMIITASSNTGIFLQGWKYIAASYICYILSILIEFIAVSLRCRMRIADLWKMLQQLAAMVFVTATPAAAMQMSYEVSGKQMGIDASFTDLWVPLSNNLLSPSRTISLVLSVFFIADMTGMQANAAFMLIMLITVVQLSLASTGTTAGSAVILETLDMSTDEIGVFSAFEVFTRNAAAAYDITYSMLEQLDAARETGRIHTQEQQKDNE